MEPRPFEDGRPEYQSEFGKFQQGTVHNLWGIRVKFKNTGATAFFSRQEEGKQLFLTKISIFDRG